MRRRLVTTWGVLGVAALIAEADVRLARHALDAFRSDLGWVEWAVASVWIGMMTYAEGFRGFHLRFSPRVVGRAIHLGASHRPVDVLLAPLYCMSLYGASRRGLRVAWGLVIGIVALVLLVRLLPPPWRGIVDAGVVAGLTTGLVSLLYHSVRALLGRPTRVDLELPTPLGSAPSTEDR